jgi:hypothetical protein
MVVMSDKLEPVADGYVRFWIEHDTEVATLTASDFRNAMNERDRLRAENERLREVEIKSLEAECVAHVETIEQLRAALTEIADLELEGDAALTDALAIADAALNPAPDDA